MRRRMMIVTGIATIALLAAIAIPVAARMGPWASTASPSQSSSATISSAQAKTAFDQYLQRQGYDHLRIREVMQFSNQFYAQAVDKQSGAGAFEMVMSLDGQVVTPEPGPSMMWNTTYSPMFDGQGAALGQGTPGAGYGMCGAAGSGMIGGYGYGYGYGMMNGSGYGYGQGMMGGSGVPNSSATPGTGYGPGWCGGGQAMGYHPETAAQLNQPLTAETAQARVQSWLDQNRPGVTATDATAFPGYVTFHTEKDGKIVGMLSIQSATGAIWEHVWHGTFVAMEPAS